MGASHGDGAYSVLDIQHPQLRNFRGITRNSENFMSASLAIQKPQYYQWRNQVKRFQQNHSNNEHILLPLKHNYDEGGVCSTTGELTIQYDSYPKLLSAQIRDRMRSKKKFTEAELWYLLYAIASARQALMSEGYQIGDLQPRNIFLNANQQIKVGSKLSWPGQVSSYRKAVLQQGYGYLAPEDMVRLKLGAMDNKQNTESQLFSLGLSMLSASVLQPMKDIYQIKQNSIDEQLFNTRLSLFQQDKTYSDIYRALVTNLLEFDAEQRMTQEQIGQFLFKHKDNLQEQKALMFDNVGRKLQQSINLINKKNNGINDNTSRYSGVSSLYAISKQNTVKAHDSQDNFMGEKGEKVERGEKGEKNMRQSVPNNNNVINYQLKKEGQSQPISPPNQVENSSNNHIPPQVSSAKPEIVTPRWNTPTKPASQQSGVQKSPNFQQQQPHPNYQQQEYHNFQPQQHTNLQQHLQQQPLPQSPRGGYISQGPPTSGGAYSYQNSPLYQPVQNGRPVGPIHPNGYQPAQGGRPMSHVPVQNGQNVQNAQNAQNAQSGVMSRQSATIVQNHVGGNVTPPHPITPIYAQPQSHKIVSIADGPELNQRYRQIEIGGRPVTFGPSQQKQQWIHQNKITEVKESQLDSVDTLLMETKKRDFVEMSSVKRKEKSSDAGSSNAISEEMKQYPPKIVDSRVQENGSEPWVDIQAAHLEDSQKEKEARKEQTPSQKLQDLVDDAEYQIETAKKAENDIRAEANRLAEQAKKEAEAVKKSLQVKRQEQVPENKMAHKVKVWGVQKGKLQIQAVNEEKKKVESFTQGVKELKIAPREIIKKVTPPLQESAAVLQSTNPNLEDYTKAPEEETPKPQEEASPEPIIEEAPAPKVQKKHTPVVEEATPVIEEAPVVKEEAAPIVEQAPLSKTEETNPEKKQSTQKDQTTQQAANDNYILIEEASRATEHQSSLVQNEGNSLFIYVSKTTNGTFEECWNEVEKSLVAPQDYNSLIKPEKVHPLENQHGQFLKIGPATLKINKNKEQGKIWLQNLPSSRCQGDFLMGVIKDSNSRHYIWFNSSLKYKNKHFPAKEMMEEALSVMKKNVKALNTQ